MKKSKIIDPFFVSLFLGLAVWLLVFWIIPVHAVKPLVKSSLGFIGLSYLSLITGYILTPVFSFKYKSKEPSARYIWIVISVIVFGFSFRYIDLFVSRSLSFSNSIDLNRKLAETQYFQQLKYFVD